jgi:hypothetical protein
VRADKDFRIESNKNTERKTEKHLQEAAIIGKFRHFLAKLKE